MMFPCLILATAHCDPQDDDPTPSGPVVPSLSDELGDLPVDFDMDEGTDPVAICEDECTAADPLPELADAEKSRIEGFVGEAMLPSFSGEATVPYVVMDGHAIYGGDVDLGPVDADGALLTARGGVPQGTAWKWPNKQVVYTIDASLTIGMNGKPPVSETILAAMDYLQRHTALTFKARTNEVDFVRFYAAAPDQTNNSDAIGRKGGQQNIRLKHTASRNTVVHEIGHAVGLFHEQQRDDADEHVVIHYECIVDEYEGNFEPQSTVHLEPYDFGSVMHYGPYGFCSNPGEEEYELFETIGCDELCPSMTKKMGGGPANTIPLPPGQSLSDHDINTLLRVYPLALGVDEPSDRYGQALAAGDFDDDGYADLAVGVPLEDLGSYIDTGRVDVFKGVDSPVLRGRVPLVQSFGGGEEPGDRWGSALGAGDLDGDGYDDLVAGAPTEDVNSAEDQGQLLISFGSYGNLGPASAWINRSKFPQNTPACAHFGMALAVGDLDANGRAEIAVACDGASLHIFSTGVDRTFTLVKTLTLPKALAYDPNALPALHVADINADKKPELIVGSPISSQVFVFRNASMPGAVALTLTKTLATTPGDHFGASLAAGDFNLDGVRDLVVGRPHANLNGMLESGLVRIYTSSKQLDLASFSDYSQEKFGSTSETGDHFGASLAVFNQWTSQPWLVVGSPGEDLNIGGTHTADVGCAHIANLSSQKHYLLYERTGSATQDNVTFAAPKDPAGTVLTPVTGAAFGSSLATRLGTDGKVHLTVGAPGASGGRVLDFRVDFQALPLKSTFTPYRYRQGTVWTATE